MKNDTNFSLLPSFFSLQTLLHLLPSCLRFPLTCQPLVMWFLAPIIILKLLYEVTRATGISGILRIYSKVPFSSEQSEQGEQSTKWFLSLAAHPSPRSHAWDFIIPQFNCFFSFWPFRNCLQYLTLLSTLGPLKLPLLWFSNVSSYLQWHLSSL